MASPPSIRIATLHADLNRRLASLDLAPVEQSRRRVETALQDGKAYYGLNTGFGGLARERIPDADIATLQRNLLLSHAVGVGEPARREISRLMLRLKIIALAQGFSGISLPTFQRLVAFDHLGLVPVVPSRGSVGASGDLAPLAHLALPLLGLGEFWTDAGPSPAADMLRKHDLAPIELGAKDGLALINGTQLMAAYGAGVLEKSTRLARLFDLAAVMSLEALQGSIKPFDARVHAVRPHPGHGVVAENVRRLLDGSEILESHRDCGKVQDPYSLRCIPQVHGASRDALGYITRVFETEINAVTDNPLVFENGDIISCGNFHGQPLALPLDFAAIALAELASISERRVYLLLEGHDGLPKLLMRQTGLNSGFMIPQYTAAALVSENKVLCHPASVDSIPTSLGQEDHVSMGSIGAVKLWQVYQNVEIVLAIELLCAAQALDFRSPLKPGRGVAAAHAHIRARIPHREADYLFQDDLKPMLRLVQGRDLLDAVEQSRDAARMTPPVEHWWTNARLATMAPGVGAKEGYALGVAAGKIAAIVPASEACGEVIDCEGRWITPGLIDCHTHLIYGGNRAAEWEMRLTGVPYAEIAKRGGGILNSVRATRALSEDQLFEAAKPPLQALIAEGVTTVEIKSGYGLTLDDELKMLRVAQRLGASEDVYVSRTLLAAHAVPPEFSGRPDDYIDLICREMIPRVAKEKLADAVDVFCESIAFSVAQCERVWTVARQHNLAVKGHVEQLTNQRGAVALAKHQPLSADHLEYLDDEGVAALRECGAVAVLLPGAYYFLREKQKPPVEKLREAGVPLAVATDLNPGTSPFASLRWAMNAACVLFGLSPEEALVGATRNAAKALGMDDVGILEVGKRADFVVWDVEHPAEIVCALGVNAVRERVRGGEH